MGERGGGQDTGCAFVPALHKSIGGHLLESHLREDLPELRPHLPAPHILIFYSIKSSHLVSDDAYLVKSHLDRGRPAGKRGGGGGWLCAPEAD